MEIFNCFALRKGRIPIINCILFIILNSIPIIAEFVLTILDKSNLTYLIIRYITQVLNIYFFIAYAGNVSYRGLGVFFKSLIPLLCAIFFGTIFEITSLVLLLLKYEFISNNTKIGYLCHFSYVILLYPAHQFLLKRENLFCDKKKNSTLL